MRNLIRAVLMGVALTVTFVGLASAATIELPDPNLEVDGVTVASKYTDFYTYPTSLLNELDAYNPGALDGYNWDIGSAGSGVLDFKIYTGAGGNQNPPIPSDPPDETENFETPLDGAKGGTSTFVGTWGEGYGDVKKGPGPVTVDDLLAYMVSIDPKATVPVFGFDMTEAQGQTMGYLWVKGKVRIMESDGVTPVEEWLLEDPTGGSIYVPTFIPASKVPYVWAPSELAVPGTSRTYMIDNNNTGGGIMDYFVYSPTLNLANYADGTGRLFLVDLDFTDLTGNSEEVFFLSGFAVPNDNVVPEPASMALLGLGLAGVLRFRRKR